MKTRTIVILFLMFLLVSCSPGGPEDGEDGNAEVTISTSSGKTIFDSGEVINLEVYISNPNNHAIKVLKWFTPIDGITRSLCSVLREVQPVDYLGILIKSNPPTEQDYVVLEAGESVTSELDLSIYYDLSISGNYEVIYDVTSIQLYEWEIIEGTSSTHNLTSNTLNLTIK